MTTTFLLAALAFLLGVLLAKYIYQAHYKRKYRQVHMNVLNCLHIPANTNPLHALTITTSLTPEAQRMMSSLSRNDVSVTALGLGCKWQGFGNKIFWLREYLEKQKGFNNSLILFMDAYDTINLASQHEIIEKFKSFKSDIVIGAEKNCWPNPQAADTYAPSPTDYRFLNAGCVIGYRDAILETISTFTLTPADSEQGAWTKFFLANQNKVKLDYKCALFFNLYGVEETEFALERSETPRLILKGTNTRPCVVHGNGPSRKLLDKIVSDMSEI